jgi:hypothetical protein
LYLFNLISTVKVDSFLELFLTVYILFGYQKSGQPLAGLESRLMGAPLFGPEFGLLKTMHGVGEVLATVIMKPCR